MNTQISNDECTDENRPIQNHTPCRQKPKNVYYTPNQEHGYRHSQISTKEYKQFNTYSHDIKRSKQEIEEEDKRDGVLFRNIFTIERQKVQPILQQIVLLKSNKNGTELKFPVYNDEEIGIDKDNNIILCKHYDNDDDIDTNTSVLEYFQDQCITDLEESFENCSLKELNCDDQKGYFKRFRKCIN